MMVKILKILSLFFLLIISAGCSQKITIRALEPSEIERAASTKKVSVAPFENDRVGLSDKIEVNLANQKIDNKNYFTTISRKDFDKIIEEQKVQSSGLVDATTAATVGNLLGAEAIISGRVGRVTSNDTHYFQERYRCADKKCKEMISYQVRCVNRVVGLSADIRMVDVAKGDIIYGDTMNKTATWSHCSDDSNSLPSSEMAAQRLATIMADNFTYKLTPHYRNFDVVLLEDPDIDYGKNEKKLLDISLEYIEQNRLDKAEQFLVDLVDATAQRSYVPFYNLGVVKEAQGRYKEAQEYYKRADELMVKPVEEINRATVRITDLIEKNDRVKEQLAK